MFLFYHYQECFSLGMLRLRNASDMKDNEMPRKLSGNFVRESSRSITKLIYNLVTFFK